jgi:hypothetical protein
MCEHEGKECMGGAHAMALWEDDIRSKEQWAGLPDRPEHTRPTRPPYDNFTTRKREGAK